MFARALRTPLLSLLLVAAFVLAFVPTPVRAGEIPSAASGEYSTPVGTCAVVFSRFGADHVNVDIACPGDLGVGDDGRVWCVGVCSHSTAFAWRSACIGAPGVAYAFPVSGSDPASQWLAFDSYSPDGRILSVRRGVTAAQLYNGGGVPELWTGQFALSSPQPYTCGGKRPTSGPRLGR